MLLLVNLKVQNNKMILYGASGHAKVIIDILEQNNITISTIFDDNKDLISVLKYPIKQINDSTIDDELIISIGNNKIRKTIANKLKNNTFGKAIHTKAIIDKTVKINNGTVVMANTIINASSNIGKHCIINTNAVIEHDCTIDNFVHISPSATLCGNIKVGEGTHIGAGSTIIPNINIGKWCIIGAGSVVIKDIPDNVTVVGNPARIIKQH